MSKRIEELISNYPQMTVEKRCLANQLASFRGLTADEVILSMYTPQLDGERVQTSGTSDKTAQIALNYQTKMDQMNREWYDFLEKKLRALNDELSFFENSLRSLPDGMADVMCDLVLSKMTWDAVAAKHHMSRANVGKIRKRSLTVLDELYAAHDQTAAEFLLS